MAEPYNSCCKKRFRGLDLAGLSVPSLKINFYNNITKPQKIQHISKKYAYLFLF